MPRLESAGFEAEAAGLGHAESHSELARRFPDMRDASPAERLAFTFPRLFGTVRAPPMLADLLPIVERFGPSIVIRDAGEFAAPIAAALACVPSLTHSYGRLIPAERINLVSDRVAGLWVANGLEPRAYGGSYDDLYLDIYPPSMQSSEMDHVPAVQSLRPAAYATPGGDAPLEWLQRSSLPLIYLTFGTVYNKDTELFSTIVRGLRALSARLLVTVGPSGDPALLGEQPPNVHVARYIPQDQLLGHCAAVASHAGSGTFLAALSHGLPQLCMPQAADQFLNTRACVEAGVGLALEGAEITESAVADAGQRLLSDTEFRAAAGRVAEEITHMPPPNEVAQTIVDQFL